MWAQTLNRRRHRAPEERQAIRRLKVGLGIEEGAFYARRRAEVRDVLTSQVRHLLIDESVDYSEALYQVELQRLFDLGYDQYLELTRDEFKTLVDKFIERVAADGVVRPEDAQDFRRRLSALDTVYRLTPEQRTALAQAGCDVA